MIEPNNTTMWTNPSNSLASPDCSRWSNGLTDLCYACDSCRASVLANVKQPWRKIALLSVIVLVVIIVVYVIACCAFQNAQINKHRFRRNTEGWYMHNTWRWNHSKGVSESFQCSSGLAYPCAHWIPPIVNTCRTDYILLWLLNYGINCFSLRSIIIVVKF